jgi:hypothetical protein
MDTATISLHPQDALINVSPRKKSGPDWWKERVHKVLVISMRWKWAKGFRRRTDVWHMQRQFNFASGVEPTFTALLGPLSSTGTTAVIGTWFRMIISANIHPCRGRQKLEKRVVQCQSASMDLRHKSLCTGFFCFLLRNRTPLSDLLPCNTSTSL